MNVVLLAGGRMSEDDPLYHHAPGGQRSLIDVHGKPMVQWVLDALCSADAVNQVYIMGLASETALVASKPIHYLQETGGLFENIRSGVLQSSQDYPEQTKVLLASADIPALQPEMVDWLVTQILKDPSKLIYYNVVPKPVMESRFPNAGRSYVYFKDLAVCGGDLNAVDANLFAAERPLWKQLTAARKNPVKQMRLLGFDSLVLIALRILTLDEAVKKVCKKLSITGSALVNPFAEIAMDADRPEQLEILRKDLEGKL